MRRPFMKTPTQLTSLEGQQYLVLRPGGPVADDYMAVQDAALKSVPGTVTHPHAAHVTLRGFAEAKRLDELRTLIRSWAAAQQPIEITAEAVDTFPAPWQIVIVRLARTASLTAAYASLTDALIDTDFRRLDERALEDWTFHLSVIYSKTLGAEAWAELAGRSRREYGSRPTETITEAELVWYSGGIEHYEVFPLGR